jgi:hypothetical protein
MAVNDEPLERRGDDLLTEAEVQRSYSQLIYRRDIDEATFDEAELLVEELRPESPLRLRLLRELEELRQLRRQA